MERVSMSIKDIKRVSILEGIRSGKYSNKEAAEALGISIRQVQRLHAKYKAEGSKGVIHGLVGKSSNHKEKPELRWQVIAIYKERYEDFGPTLASEKLEEEGIKVKAETLRLWLRAERISYPNRKRKKFRRRRNRKERFGELLQLDGSFHRWFREDKEETCILTLIDDATGVRKAIMDEEETTSAAMRLLKMWVKDYGIPKGIYVDLKTVYVSPKDRKGMDVVEENPAFTHFNKACSKLGIKIIKAYSPQAKGRVERSHRVLQDRFLKELRLRNVVSIEGANELLLSEFMVKLNLKFATAPLSPQNAHREAKLYGNLDNILCWEYQRILGNDCCISYNKQVYQITNCKELSLYPKAKVTIREHLDTSVTLWVNEQKLKFERIYDRIALRTAMFAEQKTKPYQTPSQLAKRNINKTPWRTFNPNWIKHKNSKATRATNSS